MSIQKVRDYFSQWGMEDKVMELTESSATVEDQPILIVFAGDARVDNHKYKERFHKKASMIKADQVEDLIGHPVGGVCPFAIHPGGDVYLDESLKRFHTVFPACGTANSAIELTLDELMTYSKAREWVDVSKGWQEDCI